MGSPCWGAPQHGLMPRSSNEFPDMRIQYPRTTLVAQIRDVEQQTDALLDRIVEASSPAVVTAYEARIDKLERQKIRLR